MKLTRIFVLLILMAGSALADLSYDRFDKLLGEDWFGIYMQDNKIGYASIALAKESEDRWSMSSNLVFVFSMNQTTLTMTSSEERIYEGVNAELVSSKFTNSSDAGIISVEGKKAGDEYIVTTNVVGQITEKSFDMPVETLDDALQIEIAAISGRLNSESGFKFLTFVSDPPLTGIYEHIITIPDHKQMIIGGIETDVFTVRDSISSLLIAANIILDEYGNHLRQEIPTMGMTMKSEPKEMAQKIELGFDMLNDNIIKASNGPKHPRRITKGTYILSGYQIDRLPESEWVNITELSADSAELSITIPTDKTYDRKIGKYTDEFEQYLKPEPLIQSDNREIIDLAIGIIGDETNAYRATQLINDWVYSNIEKAFSPDISNALQTYKSGRGDCGEHSALTAALLRAAGIPSRIAAGVVYWPGGEGFAFHAWVEAYVGEWIQIDPTLNESLADATHIMLASGRLKDNLIAIAGNLRSINIRIVSYE